MITRWNMLAMSVVVTATVACGGDDKPSPKDAGGTGKPDAAAADGGGMTKDASGGSSEGGTTDAGPDKLGSGKLTGKLDTKFGSGGYKPTKLDAYGLVSAFPAPADKFLLLSNGQGGGEPARVYRFDYEGKLDTSYGSAGWAVPDAPLSASTMPADVDSQGRFVFVTRIATGEASDAGLMIWELQIRRLDAKGQPDASFGDAGIVALRLPDFVGLGGDGDIPTGTVLDVRDDGSMILGGYLNSVETKDRQWIVLGFEADGSLDKQLNGKGFTLIDSGHADQIDAMHVSKDGTIYGVVKRDTDDDGNVGDSIVAFKLSAAGKQDTAYGNDGLATLVDKPGFGINALLEDAEHRLVVAGSYPKHDANEGSAAYAVRLTTAGKLDASFGKDGEVIVDFHPDFAPRETWNDALGDVFQDGDQLVLGGYVLSASDKQPDYLTLLRLGPDGELDPSFAFTSHVETVSEASPAIAIENGAFVGPLAQGAVLLPTPDGEHILGIASADVDMVNKIVFVRWN